MAIEDSRKRVEMTEESNSQSGAARGADPNRWKALALLGIAYLMVVLDVAITNVALPSIQHDLGISIDSLQWVVGGYALTFGGFLLLGGRLGDLLGRRRLFMVGLAVFAMTSLLAGLATSAGTLIAARVAQGAAAAMLSPSVFSITSVTFQEGSERNKALGILGAIAGSGAAIGVLLGGVLTEYAGWQWIFFVNVPVGLLALFFAPRVIRESRADGLARHFDAAGAVTVTGSLMLLMLGLTRSITEGWTSVQTIGSLVASAALMAAFLRIETRSRSPLIRLGIFRRRSVAGGNIIGFGLGSSVFGMFFLLSLYMQQVLGFSPLTTGAAYLAVTVTVILTSTLSQALVTRIGVKRVLAAGLVSLALGLLYFTGISADGSYAIDLLPGFLLIGLGMGFSFVPVSIAALSGVSSREAGLASGLINTSLQVGGAVGLAVLTTVATFRTDQLIASGSGALDALTGGFSLAFWVGVAVALGSLVTALTLLPGDAFAPPKELADPDDDLELESEELYDGLTANQELQPGRGDARFASLTRKDKEEPMSTPESPSGNALTSSADALPDYAPIPPSSLGPAPNEQGYYVGRVERNLYWVTDGVYQAAFLTTQDGVILFDAPPSIGHNLQRAIDEIAQANGVSNKVTYLVHTHHHADHGGASSIFGKDVVRIGHEETRRLLLRDDDPARPAPEETFGDRRTLEIGGERIELAWHGANHTPDNSVVHFPEHDALMMVDIVNVGWVPVYVVNLSDDIPGYLSMPATALTYPWKTLISGHLGRLGTRDDVTLHQRYMADLEASAKTALATVDPTPYFQKYGAVGNMWGAVKAYLNAVGDATAAPVIEKYTGVLAAADVFTPEVAFWLMESMRLNRGIGLQVHP